MCKLLIQSFYFNTLISCVGICWWKFHLRTTRLMKLCQVHVSMNTSRTLYKRPMGTMEGLVLPDLLEVHFQFICLSEQSQLRSIKLSVLSFLKKVPFSTSPLPHSGVFFKRSSFCSSFSTLIVFIVFNFS